MSLYLHPRKNSQLIGHDKQIKIFKEVLDNNKLHHTWLLEGPAGVGKATFAYSIARSILSKNNLQTNSLFEEDINNNLNINFDKNNLIHNRIAENTHVDLKVLERENIKDSSYSFETIPVENVRKIQPFFSKTAGEGGKKILIIDSIENLNLHGCNALLKIIEEPPKDSLIFIISNNKFNVIDTIRSRCRLLKFNTLSDELTKKIIVNNIKKNIDDVNLEKIIILSNGAPGKGLLLLNNNGLELYDYIIEIFKILPNLNDDNIGKIYNLINSKTNSFDINIFKELITIFISRTYRKSLNIITTSTLKEEENAQNNIINKFNIADLCAIWEKSYEEINTTNFLNLDKKQVIINFINNIKKMGSKR